MEEKNLNAGPGAVALAALYIVESLLLELQARGILKEDDVQGLLQDAAKTLQGADGGTGDVDHLSASRMVETIRLQYERVAG